MKLFILLLVGSSSFAQDVVPPPVIAGCGVKFDSGYVQFQNGIPIVPDRPFIGYINGDGIGLEISPLVRKVVDQAVAVAYQGAKQINWQEVLAGEIAFKSQGDALPASSVEQMKKLGISIKGPMNTPQAYISPNVRMRKLLDAYSCVRPVRYFPNIPSRFNNPDEINLVLFRENTEDVYSGVEFAAGSLEAKIVTGVINAIQAIKRGPLVRWGSSIGIKPISEFATRRHMRRAMQYAIEHGINKVTIVHKGNIMKKTEYSFREWAYDVAKSEFGDRIMTQEEYKANNWVIPEGKILVNDLIADNAFQQLKINPAQFGILVTPNLTGDLLSDDAAGLVGGLGIAPGANIGDNAAVFEATHGTAPDIMGQNKANPTSLLLSAVMMLDYMGWGEAARLIEGALKQSFNDRVVTGDLRKMENAKTVSTTEFVDYLLGFIKSPEKP